MKREAEIRNKLYELADEIIDKCHIEEADYFINECKCNDQVDGVLTIKLNGNDEESYTMPLSNNVLIAALRGIRGEYCTNARTLQNKIDGIIGDIMKGGRR